MYNLDKVAIVLLSYFFTATALASGSFICTSNDKSIVISGGQSSAGVWVSSAKINGLDLIKDKDFTADQIYMGQNTFNILLMDGNRNNHLLRLETVKYFDKSAGLGVLGKKSQSSDSEVIVCEFSY